MKTEAIRCSSTPPQEQPGSVEGEMDVNGTQITTLTVKELDSNLEFTCKVTSGLHPSSPPGSARLTLHKQPIGLCFVHF